MATQTEHGTHKGFQQHKALGSAVCEPCRVGHNAYQAQWMRDHYTPEKRRAAYLRRKARGLR